jgi:hypothetical protein
VLDLIIDIHGADVWAKVKLQRPPSDFVVRAIGKQFNWGSDGKFGTDDDLTTDNELHIPVNKPIHVVLSSRDVVHSFLLRHFRLRYGDDKDGLRHDQQNRHGNAVVAGRMNPATETKRGRVEGAQAFEVGQMVDEVRKQTKRQDDDESQRHERDGIDEGRSNLKCIELRATSRALMIATVKIKITAGIDGPPAAARAMAPA